MRPKQIGVIGSAADLESSPDLNKVAQEIGWQIAKHGHILMFGAGRDNDSLPEVAARSAKAAGGTTVSFLDGKTKDAYLGNFQPSILVTTGIARGGGREFVLVNSCDAIIMISGGVGTLNEAAIAYQSRIPIVALSNSGGWASKLAGTYIDGRKRVKVIPANTATEAVRFAELLRTE